MFGRKGESARCPDWCKFDLQKGIQHWAIKDTAWYLSQCTISLERIAHRVDVNAVLISEGVENVVGIKTALLVPKDQVNPEMHVHRHVL